jgi:hypothetical protein
MGLFKNKKGDESNLDVSELPELPELPSLPKLDFEKEKSVHQLPRFPNDSLGEKFSQNIIKEAVTGKKEDRVFADEFARMGSRQMMQEPEEKFFPDSFHSKKMTREDSMEERGTKSYPEGFDIGGVREIGISKDDNIRIAEHKKSAINGPIFVRIDRFEDGLKALEKTQAQISEIEILLRNIQKVREEEERELGFWERKIQAAKAEIEKIDNDIFSKIE